MDGVLLEAAAALLKHGKYRSGPHYMSALKRAHLEAGFAWPPQLALLQSDICRALRRGVGPARQAAVLPIDDLLRPDRRHSIRQ